MPNHITEVIDLPGKFCGWFDGSNLIQTGDVTQESNDLNYRANAQMILDAYRAGKRINRGRGYSWRITLTGDPEAVTDAMDYLSIRADDCMVANSDTAFGFDRDQDSYSEWAAGQKLYNNLCTRVKALVAEHGL